jgi:glycosyltransferase involved in cell wall biosynthesis
MSCGRDERSGMPTSNTNIGGAMRALGWTVDHLYLDDFPAPVRVKGLRYPLFGLATVARVRSLEARHGCYDVVQISGGDGYLAPLLRRDRRGRRRLVVALCHGLEHRYWRVFRNEVDAGRERASLRHRMYFGRLRLKQAELSIRRADLLNCRTAADARYAIERGWKRADETLVLPVGIAPAWFGAAHLSDAPPERMLFCGSWTWMKGTRVLVRSFERLAERHRNLRLTVLGAGADPAMVLGAFDPAVRDRVTVMPALSHADVLREVKQHDFLLATSLFEGFGTAVLEAMAAGLPVVASAVGAAPDYIDHGRSGYLVPAGDVDRFVSSCGTLLASSARARRVMGQAATEAMAGLTWPVIAEATTAAYSAAFERVGE